MSPKTIKPAHVLAKGEDTDGESDDAKQTKYPTPQEAYVFFSVVKHIRGKPDVDWEGVAKDCGFKNAETAKVRYGQIKRKLHIEKWDYTKKKTNTPYEELDYSGSPSTPTTGRTKTGPVTPRTGSSIKKRTSAVSKRPMASRQAKSEALVKMEQAEQAMEDIDEYEGEEEEEDDGDELAMSEDETPTKMKKKSVGLMANKYINKYVKKEPDTKPRAIHRTTTAPNFGISSAYANFPSVIPDVVLERKAILVNMAGHWIVSPSNHETHAEWLARLPANIQSEFYTQSQRMAARAVETLNAINAINAAATAAAAGDSDSRPYIPNPNHRHTVAAFQQYMRDNGIPHYSNNHGRSLAAAPQPPTAHQQQMFLPTDMVLQQMGMHAAATTTTTAAAAALAQDPSATFAATAEQLGLGQFAHEDGLPRGPWPDYNNNNDNNNNNNNDDDGNDDVDVDLQSVPLHPSCVVQQQQKTHEAREAREAVEREEREQEERDTRMLFEGISDSADSE